MPEALTLHQFKERDPSVAAGSTLQPLFVLTFSKDKHESGDCFEWRVMQEVLSAPAAADAFLHCVDCDCLQMGDCIYLLQGPVLLAEFMVVFL